MPRISFYTYSTLPHENNCSVLPRLGNGDINRNKIKNVPVYFCCRGPFHHTSEITNRNMIKLTTEKLPMSPYFSMTWVIFPLFSATQAPSQYKDGLSRYGNFNYRDTTDMGPSYLYNGNPNTTEITAIVSMTCSNPSGKQCQSRSSEFDLQQS